MQQGSSRSWPLSLCDALRYQIFKPVKESRRFAVRSSTSSGSLLRALMAPLWGVNIALIFHWPMSLGRLSRYSGRAFLATNALRADCRCGLAWLTDLLSITTHRPLCPLPRDLSDSQERLLMALAPRFDRAARSTIEFRIANPCAEVETDRGYRWQ